MSAPAPAFGLDAALLDEVDLGLLSLDGARRIGLWNRWMTVRTGITAEQARGRLFAEVFPDLAAGRIAQAIDQALDRGQSRLLTPALTKVGFPLRAIEAGGATPEQRVMIQPVAGPDGRRCLIQIADVSTAAQRERTLLRQAEALRLANAEMEQARDAAERANSAKSRFLAAMSHELRTPLNAIIGFAQLLAGSRREPLSETQTEFVRQIEEGGEYLLRLIDDVLNLARLEAGKLHVEVGRHELRKVLRRVAGSLRGLAERSDVTLIAEEPPAGLEARMDPLRLVQVLTNLGSNAIKYNRKLGEVRLSAAALPTGGVRIEVADTGMGIPIEAQGRLFQPFERLGQERGSIEGTGIGLAISKQLTEMMGGRIGFESAPGVGSRFWVDLQAADGPADAASAAGGADALVARLVLLVEERPALLHVVSAVIAALPESQLLAAESAEGALELARRGVPDVVIVDLDLPDDEGRALARAMREDPLLAATRLIAVAAPGAPQIEDGVAFAHLVKPASRELLAGAVTAALAGASTLTPSRPSPHLLPSS